MVTLHESYSTEHFRLAALTELSRLRENEESGSRVLSLLDVSYRLLTLGAALASKREVGRAHPHEYKYSRSVPVSMS